jgi:hypothetical protein
MSILKGTFTSIWDDGEVTTACTLDTDTGELFPETADVSDFESLISERFDGDDCSTYGVCNECHKYILIGNEFCTDPNCESNSFSHKALS